MFVKAEKCEFHQRSVPFLGFIVAPGSIQMEEAKVSAVSDWPVPLHALTSPGTRFQWNPQAGEPFQALKKRFTSVPILTLPDPELQFIIEVDASNVWVGGVLSQRSPKDNKVHLCAFFSKRLSPAERNYDVVNRELLALKLALEEWRHWLEGAGQPFLAWTDHKNLEYIRTAKRLNSRQARWELFFNRFDFTLSYRPGSR